MAKKELVKSSVKSAKQVKSRSRSKEVTPVADPFIHKLEVTNFKSIRELKLATKRVNIFIGAPNSGKTCILEALAMLSEQTQSEKFLTDTIRIGRFRHLFHNQNIETNIRIGTDKISAEIGLKNDVSNKYASGNFFNWFLFNDKRKVYSLIAVNNSSSGITFNSTSDDNDFVASTQFSGKKINFDVSKTFRFYRYSASARLDRHSSLPLSCPDGDNLIHLLLVNKKLRTIISDLLKTEGLGLRVLEHENKVEIVQDIDGISFVYPYESLADTLRRFIFYQAVLVSNQEQVILLDEPDTHAFPKFVKQLAEEIAYDKKNQYFITTHNPYMLGSLMEKTPLADLNVCICRREEGETKVYALNKNQIQQVVQFDVDAFFNLDAIIDS